MQTKSDIKYYISKYVEVEEKGEEIMNRDALYTFLRDIGAAIVEDQPGNYDHSLDGWLVFTLNNAYFKVDFYDDSYTSGYVESITKVNLKKKTVTVWE